MMDFKTLQGLNEHYFEATLTFDKDTWKFLSGKDTPRGRMLGFLTPEYYKREKLWQTGTIVWGYAFKSYMDNAMTSGERVFPSWVLFSPTTPFQEDPTLYYPILEKLTAFLAKKPKKKAERALKIALEGELSEPQYMEIPTEFTDGKLVFLSMVYVRPTHLPGFHLGVLPLMINKTVTSEVMYVPDRFWTEEFKAHYFK